MEVVKPQYGTWIRKKAIAVFVFLTVLSIAGLFFFVVALWFLLFIIPAVIFGYILLIISLSSYRFSAVGGDFQRRIHNLIVEQIGTAEPNKILDIGCGSGHLAINIAKHYKNSQVAGIDYWGDNWEYSKQQAETNATLEGVEQRTYFTQGTASKLSFDDNSFDCVVSCLTFHEVRDVDDKLICISEALRVLKPGGRFVFFDLFLDSAFYPALDVIQRSIGKNGGTVTEVRQLSEYFKLPFPLGHKKVLGYALTIIGNKAGSADSG